MVGIPGPLPSDGIVCAPRARDTQATARVPGGAGFSRDRCRFARARAASLRMAPCSACRARARDAEREHADDPGRTNAERLDLHVHQARGHALDASFVWMVLTTRWPVMEACMAMSAVSLSRISPTMMTSGSWRKNARIALAKVSPIFGCTWTWWMPEISYSTGSSAVRMFTSALLILLTQAWSVVVLAAAGSDP